jgi:hypothetical protein
MITPGPSQVKAGRGEDGREVEESCISVSKQKIAIFGATNFPAGTAVKQGDGEAAAGWRTGPLVAKNYPGRCRLESRPITEAQRHPAGSMRLAETAAQTRGVEFPMSRRNPGRHR